ncbi:MAG: rhamnulokinase [Planctomycetes bacterium]|nr:rhamnulokinase [Planctomycetota bacterium]
MTGTAEFLAFDLGASSGRAMLVTLEQGRFRLTEVHRFRNGPMQIGGGYFWDAERLLAEIKTGLRACLDLGGRPRTLGIDTWGVDFGLLDEDGRLIGPPRHYRDPRNDAAMKRVHDRVPRARIYESTGIQFMPLNTLYQLAAAAQDSEFRSVRRLLFMPDLLNYWLTGVGQTERTIASTSQIMNARTGQWDRELLDAIGVPAGIMPEIRQTGRLAGPLTESLAIELGRPDLQVVLTAGHDTASAIAAVPASGDRWAYISSGTWSLVGVELNEPLIDADSLAANFTNEAGYGRSVRFLKNVAGLWLLQECVRCWREAGRDYAHDQLVSMAERSEPLVSLIDPNDPRFSSPGDMPARIAAACRDGGQPVPVDEAAMVRCIFDSLALCYSAVLRTIETLTGRKIEEIHVVGGGSRNDLLNRQIAAAGGRVVIAGPDEATALGNAGVQAIAVGALEDIRRLRRTVRDSTDLRTFHPPDDPQESRRWADAEERFRGLVAQSANPLR